VHNYNASFENPYSATCDPHKLGHAHNRFRYTFDKPVSSVHDWERRGRLLRSDGPLLLRLQR